jgi:hypothetical protein
MFVPTAPATNDINQAAPNRPPTVADADALRGQSLLRLLRLARVVAVGDSCGPVRTSSRRGCNVMEQSG